jgi:hypothetical protein
MKDQRIVQELQDALEEDGRVTCATMHRIAGKLHVEPLAVGDTATELEIKASQCQLGLFGHGPRGQGRGRIVQSLATVSEELAARLRGAVVNDKLPCDAAWDLASEFKLTRLDLGNAAETLGLSISPCQLGFF